MSFFWPECEQDECRGACVGAETSCLAHAGAKERSTTLERFSASGELDVRGVTLSDALLREIFNAAPRNAGGHRIFSAARFDWATFEGDADFGQAMFEDHTSFTAATFNSFARFSGATFEADAWFDQATFNGGAEFGRAAFGGLARFGGASIHVHADFRYATFKGGAGFGEATFDDFADARFDGASFEGAAEFDSTRFEGGAGFAGARFRGDTQFRWATFEGLARFDEATFAARAQFDRVTFKDGTQVDGATVGSEAGFGGATFKGDARFGGASFEGAAEFDDATFEGRARFDEARFEGRAGFFVATFKNRADFREARFGGNARFVQATFEGDVGFDEATFEGDTRFRWARFEGTSAFVEAIFKSRAEFRGTRYEDDAKFDEARFEDSAWFDEAWFRGDARFDGARFEGAALEINHLIVWGTLSLDRAQFTSPTRIDVRARQLSCRQGRFLGGVRLNVSRAVICLDDSDISAPSLIAGPARTEDRPRLVSLQRANVAGLALASISLADCRFAGAHNLDQLRLEADTAFGLSPARPGWERRQVIAEESAWRAGRTRPGRWASPPWPDLGDPPGTLSPGAVAGLYRALRKGREDAKDEPGAADFYYGEMEMRRHERAAPGAGSRSRGRATRAVLFAYWLVSGYGLRAWRSLAALVLVTALFAVAFHFMGFIRPPEPASYWTSLLFAFRSTISLTDNQVQLTAWGAFFQALLRITGPVLLGLTLLALRGRVKR